MRIIEQGILPSEHKIKCKNCNTLFIVEDKKMKITWQGYYKVKSIECPYCHVLLNTLGDKIKR